MPNEDIKLPDEVLNSARNKLAQSQVPVFGQMESSKYKELSEYSGVSNLYDFTPEGFSEAAYQSQSKLGSLAKGVFRTLGKAVTEVIAIPGYVAAPFTGFDNAWIDATQSLDEGIKAALPTYVSKDIQEGGIGDKLGSAAWWGTTGADGAGFMLGMLAGGAYAKAAVGVINSVGKALGMGAKAIEGAEALATVEKIIAEGNGLSKAARVFNPLKNIVNPFGKTMAESTATVVINTMAEAGAEANNTYKNLLADLTTSGMDAEEAKNLASDAAMNVYGLNLGVLLLSNTLMEKYVFRPLSVQAKPNVKLLANMFEDGGKGATRSAWNKTFQFGKTALGGTSSEGFWEEGMQTVIQQVAEQNAKEGDASLWNVVSNILPKYLEDLTALEETADSKEFYEGVVLGGLLSLPFGVAGTRQTLKNEKAYLEGDKDFTPNSFQKNVLRMRERKANAGLIEVLRTNMELNTMKMEDFAVMENGKPKFVNGELQYDPEKLSSISVAIMDMAKDKVETDAIKTLIESSDKSPKNEVLLKMLQHKQDVQLLGKYAAIKDGDKVFETHVDYYLNKWKTAQIESGKEVTEQDVIAKRTELVNKVKVMSGIFEQVNETNDASTKEYKDKPIFRQLIKNRKIDTALQIDLFSNEVRKLSESFVDDIEVFLNTTGPKNKENTTYNKLEEDRIKLLKEKQKFYQTQLEKATEEYTKLYTKEGMKEVEDYIEGKNKEIQQPKEVQPQDMSLEEVLTSKGLNASKVIHVNSGGYGFYISPSKEEAGKFFIKTKDKSKDAWVISSDGTLSNKAVAVEASVAKDFLNKNKQFIVSEQESADIKVAKENLEKERLEREKIESYKKVLGDYLIDMQNGYLALQKRIEDMDKKSEEEKQQEELEEKKESLTKTIESITNDIRDIRKSIIGMGFDEQTASDILQEKETKVDLIKKQLSVIKGQLTKLNKKIQSRKSEIEERQTILDELKERLGKYDYTINVLESIKAEIESKSVKQQEIEYLQGAWRELYEFFKADGIETIERRSFIKMLGENMETFLSNVQKQKDALDKTITASQELLDESSENIKFAENSLIAAESKLAEIEEDINFFKELEKEYFKAINDKESKVPPSLRTKETERGVKEYAQTLADMYARREDYKNAVTILRQKLREFKETSDKLALNITKRGVLDNFMTDSFKEKLEELYKTKAIFDKLAKKYTDIASQNLFLASSEHSNEPVYLSTKRTNNPLTTTGNEVATVTENGVIKDKREDGKLVMNTNPTQIEWAKFTRNLKPKDVSKYKIMYFDETMKTQYPELYEQLDNDLRTANLESRDGIWQVITNEKGEPIKQNGLYLFMGLGLPEKLAGRMGDSYTQEAGKEYSKMYSDVKEKLSKGELVYSEILGTTKGYANLEYKDGEPVEHKVKEVLPNFNGTVYVGKQNNNPLNIPIGRPYVEDNVFGRTYLLNQRKLNGSEIETVLYLYSMLYGNFNSTWEGKQIIPKNPSDISVLQMFINHGSDFKDGKFQNGSRIFVRNGNLEFGIGKDNTGGIVPLADLVKYFKGEPVDMVMIDKAKEFLSKKLVYWNEKLKNIPFAIPKYDKKTNSLVVDRTIQKGEYTGYMLDNVFTLAVNPKHPVVQVNLEYSNPIETKPKIEVQVEEEKREKVNDLNSIIGKSDKLVVQKLESNGVKGEVSVTVKEKEGILKATFEGTRSDKPGKNVSGAGYIYGGRVANTTLEQFEEDYGVKVVDIIEDFEDLNDPIESITVIEERAEVNPRLGVGTGQSVTLKITTKSGNIIHDVNIPVNKRKFTEAKDKPKGLFDSAKIPETKTMTPATGLFDKAKINQTPQEKENEPFPIASDATMNDFGFSDVVSSKELDVEKRREEVRDIFKTNPILALHIIQKEKLIGSFDNYGRPNGELQDIVAVLKVPVSKAQELQQDYLNAGKPDNWKFGDSYDYSKYDAELNALENSSIETKVEEKKSTSKETREEKIARLKAKQGEKSVPIEDTNIFKEEDKAPIPSNEIPFKIITRDDARDILGTMIDSNTITRECE